jgi:hypothetical protein
MKRTGLSNDGRTVLVIHFSYGVPSCQEIFAFLFQCPLLLLLLPVVGNDNGYV